MAVEDWANDEELKQTFNQTTCKHTNDFFLATLGARITENIKKPRQLLALFPPQAEF